MSFFAGHLPGASVATLAHSSCTSELCSSEFESSNDYYFLMESQPADDYTLHVSTTETVEAAVGNGTASKLELGAAALEAARRKNKGGRKIWNKRR